MSVWPHNPSFYEINTWVWLTSLSQVYGKTITLRNVPDEVIKELASYKVDSIWLMGVWHRGPATRASALNYVHEYRHALPDIRDEDVVGSAYAIHNYEVDPHLGGREGLATVRKQLAAHGMRLILDFVPNHVAVDHPWIASHPEYFITGTPQLLKDDSGNFFAAKGPKGQEIVVANGRDPYFPGWIDTAQLNGFNQDLRKQIIALLLDMASQCDGVRCDMAMLMMDDVFRNTWGWRGVKPLSKSYWPEIIPAIKSKYPDFLFIAEAYWSLEFAMQNEGFDFTYDKTMYDRIVAGDVNGIYAHLGAHINFLEKNVRFIENHDEPRAASEIGIERSRPAAVMICTLPGGVLLHDGQYTGRRVKLPVQIGRQPNEKLHKGLKTFYQRLLHETDHEIYRNGEWTLFTRYPACDGCEGHENIIAYGWRLGEEFRLVVINLRDTWSQAAIDLSVWANRLRRRNFQMQDVLHGTYSKYNASDLRDNGLRVDLDPYNVHIFKFNLESSPVRSRKSRV